MSEDSKNMWKPLGFLLTVSLNRAAFGQVLFDPSFARCHPNQQNPCIDPTVSCPYSLRSASQRASLNICPDKIFLTGMKRCDKRQRTIARTDGVGGTRNGQCVDPNEPPCAFGSTSTESGFATAAEYYGLKICEDKSNDALRCDLRQRDRCLHPNQDCTAHLHRRNDADTADLTVCADLFTNGVNRCAPSQAFPCLDPTAACTADINPNVSQLKICNDKRDEANTSRCDIRQISACIDPNSECPFSDASIERRVTLPVCPEKIQQPNVNRCHISNDRTTAQPAGADNRCIDPREGFECTEASSGLARGDLDVWLNGAKFCEDLAHRDLRCKAKQHRPCIDPGQDCWEPAVDPALTICTDKAPTPNLNRCAVEQAHACINPNPGQECNAILNPNYAGLKICNDLKTAGGVTRCDLRQLVPCYDPITSCPYEAVAMNSSERRSLPICLDKAASIINTAKRCHYSNKNHADGPDVRCINDLAACAKPNDNAAAVRDFGMPDDGDAKRNYDAWFDNAKFCEDTGHTQPRCHPNQRAKCIHPLQDCFNHPRETLDVCTDAPRTPGVLRCNQSVAACIDPAEPISGCTGNVASLKICADKADVPSFRCDSRQIAPCFDPMQSCPYENASATFRSTLRICPDKDVHVRHQAKRCHYSNKNDADGPDVRCINDLAACAKPNDNAAAVTDLGMPDDGNAKTNYDAWFDTAKFCEEVAHLQPRCNPMQRVPCLHPLQDCFSGSTRPAIICSDVAPTTGLLRCNQLVGACLDPSEDNTGCNGNTSSLKICSDRATSASRCDSRQILPCMDPVDTCDFQYASPAFRSTLNACPDKFSHVQDETLRCHYSNKNDADGPDVRCINDLAACAKPNDNAAAVADLGMPDDGNAKRNYDAWFDTAKFCQDTPLSHNTPRCNSNQRDACFDPLVDCFDQGTAARPTAICADVRPTTGVLRCNQSVGACIDPNEDIRQCTLPNVENVLRYCSDLAATGTLNRCHRLQLRPCIDPGEYTSTPQFPKGSEGDRARDCPYAVNPNGSALKICPDEVNNADLDRCDVRQSSPCIDPNEKCPYYVPGRASLPTCTDRFEHVQDPAKRCHYSNKNDADGPDVRCINDLDACAKPNDNAAAVTDLGMPDDGNAKRNYDTWFDDAKYCEDSTLVESNAMNRCFSKNLNDECYSRNFPLPRTAGGERGVTECFQAADADGKGNYCPGQEKPCDDMVTNKCLNPEEADCPNLTYRAPLCTVTVPARDDPIVRDDKKRCHTEGAEPQSYPCIDPTEADCTSTENANFPGSLNICGDRAFLLNRCDRRLHEPCIDPTIECPTSTTTPSVLTVCTDLKHEDPTVPRCSTLQPFNKACIDPASPCNASLNPAWQTLKVCEDLRSGFNRCDPLQRTRCIDPAHPCPHGIDITGLTICVDLAVNDALNRCHTSQRAPCLNPVTPCQIADNPAPDTLSICADLTKNYNRCHPMQLDPCKDPTAPCTATINPNHLSLPVCADLVSDAPSTLPSSLPSNLPSLSPSTLPSNLPSLSPSDIPSGQPSLSISPSAAPSAAPSASPSASPSLSANPSAAPSASPSAMPSASPSVHPSESPSVSPSSSPSMSPSSSKIPSSTPSFRPTVSVRPTFKGQTYEPSDAPSAMPSSSPSVAPSAPPSIAPSGSPSASPSDNPSASPSTSPTSSPSVSPSGSPSSSPSVSPSSTPTLPGGPSAAPSVNCVDDPDFLLDENENRNCEWVRENPDRVDIRCAKVDSVTNVAVADACPLSCNPECEEFVPTATPVTLEPTVSPETQCGEDDPDFLFQNREGKNCEWVASRPNKTEKRCDKTDTDGELVSTKCTFTCQLRCVCKNSKKKFRLNGEKKKCKDVGRNQCDQGVRFRGRNTFVKERCPKKCNYCFDL